MRTSLVLSLVLAMFPAWAQPQQPKKRVAVLNFEYGTVSSGAAAIFGQNVDIGKGIADLLVDQLVRDGVYTVVERKNLDKVLTEQAFSNSDRADTNTAVKLGRVLGVDAIVIGSITQFGRDDKTQSVSGLGRVAGRYGLGGVGKRESKAVVGISARMISTETAEVLMVANGKGESSRSGAALLGSGGGPQIQGAGAADMSSRNFAQTIIGEATAAAVTDLARQVNQNVTRLPNVVRKVNGLVADVSGKTLILNIGTAAGIKVGDRLEVKRVGRTITDPATGKVLRQITDSIGQVTINEADERSSVGTFSGSGQPSVGDQVVVQ
ncbi:MAG: curli production assembly protein CsgG [Bryobacterales bacterium]|nr:curli production assembly protein CsgG [Bryobacterales bacterium]